VEGDEAYSEGSVLTTSDGGDGTTQHTSTTTATDDQSVHTTASRVPADAHLDGTPLQRFCSKLSTMVAPLVRVGAPCVRFFMFGKNDSELQTVPYGRALNAGGKVWNVCVYVCVCVCLCHI
jgi:hypothetical protein